MYQRQFQVVALRTGPCLNRSPQESSKGTPPDLGLAHRHSCCVLSTAPFHHSARCRLLFLSWETTSCMSLGRCVPGSLVAAAVGQGTPSPHSCWAWHTQLRNHTAPSAWFGLIDGRSTGANRDVNPVRVRTHKRPSAARSGEWPAWFSGAGGGRLLHGT